jgi:hypothetical protein
MTTRGCRCCQTKPSRVETCQQTLPQPRSLLPNRRSPNWRQALVPEIKIEQSHNTSLDDRWRRSHRVTEIAQSLRANQLEDLDGAEHVGWIDGSQLKRFFTCNKGGHGTPEMCIPNTKTEEESEEFEKFVVETLAGQKYIERRCMYFIKYNHL